jgi:hypothetical protein
MSGISPVNRDEMFDAAREGMDGRTATFEQSSGMVV